VRLKEHGPAQLGLDGQHGGVEALKMAGLKDELLSGSTLFGECNQLVGFSKRGGQRLFDQQVEAGLEQGGRDGVVMNGGDGDRGGIQLQIGGEKLVNGREDGNLVLSFGFGGAGRVGLDGRDQGDALAGCFELAIDPEMVAAESSGSNDRYAKLGRVGYWAVPVP
jgi:hypothetical protein